MSKQETEQKKIVFYHFIETSPQESPSGVKAVPSNMIVHVKGGEVHRDSRGAAYVTEYRDIKFLKGKLELDAEDTEAIETLRNLAKADRTITEDEDVYLARIATPASKAKLQEKNDALKKENVDLKEKNAALAAKLSELKLVEKLSDLADKLKEEPAAAGA